MKDYSSKDWLESNPTWEDTSVGEWAITIVALSCFILLMLDW